MWTQGKVEELEFDANRKSYKVKVKYMYDISIQSKWFQVDSPNIAQFGSKREDDVWRHKLKRGDQVDCLARSGKWHLSTVIDGEERDNPLFPNVKFGFREYVEWGSKSDFMGKYNGLDTDEFIGSFTVRVQKPNTFSKTVKEVEI